MDNWNMPLPTQDQLNAYFMQGGTGPWNQMGPPRSAMGIPQDQSANSATPDQLDKLAGVLKAKQAQGAGQPPAAPPPAGVSPWPAMGGGTPPPAAAATPAPRPAGRPAAAPGGAAGVMGEMEKASLDALKEQGSSVDDMKSRLEALQKKDLPTDYRGLAALFDSWGGTNTAGSLVPSETAQQRQQQISQLEEGILKGQKGMSDEQAGLLKTKLQAQYHEDEVQERRESHRETREAQNAYKEQLAATNKNKFDVQEFDKAAKAFNSDPTVTAGMKKRDEIANFKVQLSEARTNPIAANLVPIAQVKQYVNRVSQPELQAATGEKDIPGRVEQAFKQMTEGTLTESNAKFMAQLTDKMEKENNRQLVGHMERHANVYLRTKPSDISTVEDAAMAISGKTYAELKATAGPSDDEKAQAKAWLADPKNAKSPMRDQVQALVQ